MSLPVSLLWINGSQRPSSTGRTYNVINGTSQAVVGHAACASSEDAVAAIEAADAAQPGWEALRATAKRDILLKAAELFRTPKYAERIMHAVPSETSAHGDFVGLEMMMIGGMFLEAAMWTMRVQGETMPSHCYDGATVLVERRAWGTVFAVSPSNSPLLLVSRAILIPIACGNTVVLKSSEYSPRCAGIVVEALHEVSHMLSLFACSEEQLSHRLVFRRVWSTCCMSPQRTRRRSSPR